MSTFEYLSVLISVVVGLGVTHVLQAVGRVVSRPGTQRLFWVHSLWVAYAVTQIIYFWWFQLAYRGLEEWTGLRYAFVIGYAIALYLQCVILVPDAPEPDYRAYYFSRRKWIFGVILAILLIDGVDTLMKPAGLDMVQRAPLAFAGQYVVALALFGAAMATTRVWYHGLLASVHLDLMATNCLLRPEAGL